MTNNDLKALQDSAKTSQRSAATIFGWLAISAAIGYFLFGVGWWLVLITPGMLTCLVSVAGSEHTIHAIKKIKP